MCFDVPWKSDRYRLRQYASDVVAQCVVEQKSSLCFLFNIRFFSEWFESAYAQHKQQFGKSYQHVRRLCLQAAMYYIRDPAFVAPNAALNLDVIFKMAKRFGDMQIELVARVDCESQKNPHYFEHEMLQVFFFLIFVFGFFFNLKRSFCFLCVADKYRRPNIAHDSFV